MSSATSFTCDWFGIGFVTQFWFKKSVLWWGRCPREIVFPFQNDIAEVFFLPSPRHRSKYTWKCIWMATDSHPTTIKGTQPWDAGAGRESRGRSHILKTWWALLCPPLFAFVLENSQAGKSETSLIFKLHWVRFSVIFRWKCVHSLKLLPLAWPSPLGWLQPILQVHLWSHSLSPPCSKSTLLDIPPANHAISSCPVSCRTLGIHETSGLGTIIFSPKLECRSPEGHSLPHFLGLSPVPGM